MTCQACNWPNTIVSPPRHTCSLHGSSSTQKETSSRSVKTLDMSINNKQTPSGSKSTSTTRDVVDLTLDSTESTQGMEEDTESTLDHLTSSIKREPLYSSIVQSFPSNFHRQAEPDQSLVNRYHAGLQNRLPYMAPELLAAMHGDFSGVSALNKDDLELIDPPVMSRWVSPREPNQFNTGYDQPAGHFTGRKGYAVKGKPMGSNRTDDSAPYPTSGNGHKSNRVHPASTNPSRYYIGTYYAQRAETDEYLARGSIPILRLVTTGEDITCWRGQWEYGGKGDKGGQLHVQFAVCFREKCRVPQARRILGGDHGQFTGWLEPARSDAVWDYVCKEESRVQKIEGYGSLSDNSGNRSDLDVIYETIANGASIYEIMEQFPRQFMRNHAAISKLCAMYDKPREYGEIHVEIWWGVTGSGKSHKAYHEFPDAYRKSIPGKWWDGYKGQKTVIFEEFNPEEDKELRLPELLKILDKYPYQIEIKGTSCQLKATKFIFTTNMDPTKWYDGHAQQPALARRIHKILRFTLNRDQQERHQMTGILEFDGMRANV